MFLLLRSCFCFEFSQFDLAAEGDDLVEMLGSVLGDNTVECVLEKATVEILSDESA